MFFFQDVTDLFGADLPVEGGEAGQFVWRDGPLLKALKAGHWVVLDEVCCNQLISSSVRFPFTCKLVKFHSDTTT